MLLGRARRVKLDEDRSAQLAVAEERVRIARELHDIVAHSVSLMTIQIAAARKVGARQPDAAERALAAAERTGRQSLDELRRILAVLRGADASIEASVSSAMFFLKDLMPFAKSPIKVLTLPLPNSSSTTRSTTIQCQRLNVPIVPPCGAIWTPG